MSEIFVNWQKNYADSFWYKILEIKTSGTVGAGVYFIWHGGTSPRAVYFGRGLIFERLTELGTRSCQHKI